MTDFVKRLKDAFVKSHPVDGHSLDGVEGARAEAIKQYVASVAATGATDDKVKVTDNDTTAGKLKAKLVAGDNITLAELNDGGNETLEITSNAGYFRDPVEERWDPTGGLPPDPADGDRYISTGTAGGWEDGYIYEWDEEDGEWVEEIPVEGWLVWIILEAMFFVFGSFGWRPYPYDHNDLALIQGGAPDEYYHLTAAEYAALVTSRITTVNVANYDLLTTDDILHVTRTATGACAIDLKTAQVISGRLIVIKDAGGNASANNITVTTEGAETIDGQATAVICGDYDSITIYCNGVGWFIA